MRECPNTRIGIVTLLLFTDPTKHPTVRRSDAEPSNCGREPHGADGDQRPVPRGRRGGQRREVAEPGSSLPQVSRILGVDLRAFAAAHARLHAPAGRRTACAWRSPTYCCPRAWPDRDLAIPLEPGDDLWLSGGLVIAVHALVRGSSAYKIAERRLQPRSGGSGSRVLTVIGNRDRLLMSTLVGKVTIGQSSLSRAEVTKCPR